MATINLGKVVGPQGPQGIQGVQGPKGDQGIQGPQGLKGDTGAMGPAGADGVSPTHSWAGTTLNITSAGGTSGADLKGAKGDPGTNGTNGITYDWLTGGTVPAGATGKIGDLYLNTATSAVYKKTGATTWTLQANIKGTKGDKGDTGSQGIQGPAGADGSQGPQGVPGPNEITATTDVVGLTTGQLLYNNGGKVGSVEIVDNLLSIDPYKPLSANQGKVLKGLIDDNDSAIGQNTSDYENLKFSELSSTATNMDSEGIYVNSEWKRADGTTYAKSSLLGTTPNYSQIKIDYYDELGTSIIKTITWNLTYDDNGFPYKREVN